jgi:hypothetical protein
MPKTATNCPRCRQPVVVDVEQLFDASADPQAKQRLLSGNFNLIRCQNCHYEGTLATPLVYHDADKELLLTYFPPELGLPVNEQERLIGPMIKQVVNRLPAEKRKAYLLRPQTMFTLQTMIERILEGDGITKEMLEEQQKKLNLLQRLLSMPPEERVEIIKQEQTLVDATFFNMLNRLIEASMAQNDQQTARQLALLQQDLVKNTDFGKELQKQASEAEAAVKSLQEASKTGLTREKLLDLMVNAPNDAQLNTFVSYARSGMDYEFFNILTKRIEQAPNDEERIKLTDLRDHLLRLTSEIDQAMKEQSDAMRQFLEELLKQPNIEQATEENLGAINELFVEILQNEIQLARQKNDFERSGKLQRVMGVIEKANTPPPELALVEELLGAENDEARRKILQEHADQVTPEFIELISNLSAQAGQQEQNPEVVKQLQSVYRVALRFAMESNLKK